MCTGCLAEYGAFAAGYVKASPTLGDLDAANFKAELDRLEHRCASRHTAVSK